MAHITGDGLLNLLRIQAPDVGFVIDAPLEPCGVFALLARRAGIGPAEMYTTFNMGIGFCVVVPERDADRALALLREVDGEARPIGRATRDPERRMLLPGLGLVGRGKSFAAERR
jgi:phosphoribosylformylglycinamidine cyclo-ligase